jgi:hypothetical protein
MPTREPMLQEFLTRLGEALRARSLEAEAADNVNQIYDALRLPGEVGASAANRLQVCEHLPQALNTARVNAGAIARIANAFAALEPSLAWARRTSSGSNASANWPEGHANATIVGPRGLENRRDLQIGVLAGSPRPLSRP